MKFKLLGTILLLFIIWASPLMAADTSELERKIDVLADEIDQMKMESGSRFEYHDRVNVHGYGELHYNSTDRGRTEIDNHRFVIGVHALLSDWIHLNAEIDFEHAAQELEFEFGYLDFLLQDSFNVRGGVVLVPVGFLNEFHEPPLFWSVERPEFHTG